MKDEPLNGNTNMILLRLKNLEDTVTRMAVTVGEVRDHQLRNPACSRPNLCLDLNKIVEDHSHAIQRLEKQEVRIVTWCSIVAFIVTLGVSVAVKLLV